MRIALIIHGFPPENLGGSEVYFSHLARALSPRHQVAVFYRQNLADRPDYHLTHRSADGIELFALNRTYADLSDFSGLYENRRVDQAFLEFIKNWKPDLIHIGHLLHLSLGIVPLARENRIPVVFTLNDFWLMCPLGQLLTRGLKPCPGRSPRNCSRCVADLLLLSPRSTRGQKLLGKVLPPGRAKAAPARAIISKIYLAFSRVRTRFSSPAADKIRERNRRISEVLESVSLFLAPSRFIRQSFADFGLPPDKIVYSDYGFDRGLFSENPPRNHPGCTFGFVGSLIPSKGLHVLLEAFTPIGREQIQLKIFGSEGNDLSYQQGIRARFQDPRVAFAGSFPPEQAGQAYSQIDVLVVPSLWPENSPLVIHEAILSGVPVLASRLGGIPELVQDGRNGFLFEAGNREDLRDKMEKIILEPHLLSSLRSRVPLVKSIEFHASEMEEIYRDLIDKSHGSGRVS